MAPVGSAGSSLSACRNCAGSNQAALEVEVLPFESAHLALAEAAVDGNCAEQLVLSWDGSKDRGNNFRLEKSNLLWLNLWFRHCGRRVFATVQAHSSRPVEDGDQGLPEMKDTPFTQFFRFPSKKATDERRRNLLEKQIEECRQQVKSESTFVRSMRDGDYNERNTNLWDVAPGRRRICRATRREATPLVIWDALLHDINSSLIFCQGSGVNESMSAALVRLLISARNL